MSSGKILVVDDESQIRRVLTVALMTQGYAVVDVANGEEALERICEEEYDLVILDMSLPGIGGLEACRLIRATSDAAIIMLIVRDREADTVAALDAGADDCISKPFGLPELLARMRAALRRIPQSPKSGPQIVHFEDLEINFITRRVIVQSQEVRLTPKELELLRYMIAHPNVPIPHTELLQAVWGPDCGEVDRLRVFVSQLRRKIELSPLKPKYLLTEPWVGYRFQLPNQA